jgi:hypothetical protein
LLKKSKNTISDSKKRLDYDSLRQQYDPAGAYEKFWKNYSDQDVFTGTGIHTVFNEFVKSFTLFQSDYCFLVLFFVMCIRSIGKEIHFESNTS